jgi:hypothetical protein
MTKEQLEKLTTKRLLSYYKAERKRMIRFKNRHTCECCGQTDWDLTCLDKNFTNNVEVKYVRNLRDQYNRYLIGLQTIKEILDTREHVKTK